LQHLAFPTRVRHRGQASDRRAGSVKPADSIVFVVDDDASMREALAGLVRSVGFRVETFEQAEDFLEQRRPDTAACVTLAYEVFRANLRPIMPVQRIFYPGELNTHAG